MTRDEAIAIIADAAGDKVLGECRDLIDLSEFEEWESPHDLLTAFIDVADSAEYTAADPDEDPKFKREARATLLQCRRVCVALGVLVPVDEDEYQRWKREGYGIRDKDHPKIDGVRHSVEMSWSQLDSLTNGVAA